MYLWQSVYSTVRLSLQERCDCVRLRGILIVYRPRDVQDLGCGEVPEIHCCKFLCVRYVRWRNVPAWINTRALALRHYMPLGTEIVVRQPKEMVHYILRVGCRRRCESNAGCV